MTTLGSLTGDLVTLTQALCDLPSVSGAETALADSVELSLIHI